MANTIKPINLKAVKGDTVLIEATVTRNNVIIDLTGAKAWFTLKRDHAELDADAVARKGSTGTTLSGVDILTPLEGYLIVTLNPEDTNDLEDGTVDLVWDIQIRETTGILTTVAIGRFTFLDQVTLATA